MALASRYHGAKITAGTMALYYGEAEAVLTAALPHLRRQVIEECIAVVDRLLAIDDRPGEPDPLFQAGLSTARSQLRALLADAGQPKEGE